MPLSSSSHHFISSLNSTTEPRSIIHIERLLASGMWITQQQHVCTDILLIGPDEAGVISMVELLVIFSLLTCYGWITKASMQWLIGRAIYLCHHLHVVKANQFLRFLTSRLCNPNLTWWKILMLPSFMVYCKISSYSNFPNIFHRECSRDGFKRDSFMCCKVCGH